MVLRWGHLAVAAVILVASAAALPIDPESVSTGIDNPMQSEPHAIDMKMKNFISAVAPRPMHVKATAGSQLLMQTHTGAREGQESWWFENREESEWRAKAAFTVKLGQTFRKYSSDDITLTIQGDISRMGRLNKLAERWNGPVSFACLADAKDVDTVKRTFEASRGPAHDNVALHIVAADSKWEHYPINFMRNVAIEGAPTHWIYVVDIDEEISGTMREHKTQLDRANAAGSPETIFAVASFQWKGERSSIPRDWAELGQTFRNGDLDIKHQYFPSAYRLPGLSTADFLKSENAVTLKPKESFEPYFIARKEGLPKFDTRFVGFRGNKAILFWRLQLAGWKVKVLPGLFTFADETVHDNDPNRFQHETQDMSLYGTVVKEIGMVYGCKDCKLDNDCFKRCPKTSSEMAGLPEPPKVELAPSSSFMKANFGTSDPLAKQIVADWMSKGVKPPSAMPTAGSKTMEGSLQLSSPTLPHEADKPQVSKGTSQVPVANIDQHEQVFASQSSSSGGPPTKKEVQVRNAFRDMIAAGFGTSGLLELEKGHASLGGGPRHFLVEQRTKMEAAGLYSQPTAPSEKASLPKFVVADKDVLESYLSKSAGTGGMLEPPL